MSEAKLTVPKGTVVPKHIALILDGNRRWARARGLSTFEGHTAGFHATKKLARAVRELGVHTFTIWGFSTENWDRSPEEIAYLMQLLKRIVREVLRDANKEGVRFHHLGRKDRLPKDLVDLLVKAEEETKHNKKFVLNVALDYGGRDEILRAFKRIVADRVPENKINEKLIDSYLDTGGQPHPNPDFFIRPSGEQRTSGLMPWQMVYSEYYWEEVCLPDFSPECLKEAILDYSRRRRRFGGNDKVKHFTFDPQIVAKFEIGWSRLNKIPEGTKISEYALKHLREQYGLSKELAKKAAKYMILGFAEKDNNRNWEKAKKELKEFYRLVKSEIKLAFEPSIAASLEVDLMKEIAKGNFDSASKAEGMAKKLYAEVYRISLLQAAKLARMRVLANLEIGLAHKEGGEEHWVRAENYLLEFYKALKERVA